MSAQVRREQARYAISRGLSQRRILFNYAGVASSSGEPAKTFPDAAKQVIAFSNALGLTKIDLLGFSIGGFVAQEVAYQAPDLVRRAVLVGTGPEGGERMDTFTEEVHRHAIQEPPVLENFLYLFFSQTSESQAAGRAFWARRHVRLEQDPASSMNAMAAQAEALQAWGKAPDQHRYAKLKLIRQPVLVVNGHNDIMVPTVNSFILQQELPNATLIVYPDSGHGALFQYPETFVTQVSAFLG